MVIFTGIVIGYFVTKWAHTVEEGQKYYSTAKRILSTGVVAQAFFTSFCCFLLVSIGMKVGGSIGAIFKKYGSKFVVIGVSIPVVSLIAACVLMERFFQETKLLHHLRPLVCMQEL